MLPERVLIVDDHGDFRRAARLMLRHGGFDVVGEAAGAEDGLRAIAALRPGVVVLDVQLPDGDGIDLAARIAAGDDPPVVVLVSARSAAEHGRRLDAVAARGFIEKGELSASAVRDLL